MAGKKWTEPEMEALRATAHLPYPEGYHQFGLMTGYSRSADSWEVKRRKLNLRDPEFEKDSQALEADKLYADKRSKEIAEAFELNEEAELQLQHEGFEGAPYGFSVCFFDIEATSLKGNFGRLLCVSGAEDNGKVTTFRADDPELEGTRLRDDSRVAVAARDYLEQFDIIVGWNSKGYDIPFLNTRLLMAGERPVRTRWQIDLMWKAKKFSLALHSARLDAVAKTFRTPHQKTSLDPDIWLDAALLDKDAMDYVVEHCEADVLVLREVFRHLKPLLKELRR